MANTSFTHASTLTGSANHAPHSRLVTSVTSVFSLRHIAFNRFQKSSLTRKLRLGVPFDISTFFLGVLTSLVTHVTMIYVTVKQHLVLPLSLTTYLRFLNGPLSDTSAMTVTSIAPKDSGPFYFQLQEKRKNRESLGGLPCFLERKLS